MTVLAAPPEERLLPIICGIVLAGFVVALICARLRTGRAAEPERRVKKRQDV